MDPARGRAPLPRPPSLSRAHARRQAHPGSAPAVGAQPVLLPDADPDQGRDHSVEVRRPGVPAHVDPPHPGPRRRGRRARALAPAGRGGGPRSRRGRELSVGAPRGPLRLRRLRRARAGAKPRGGGGLLAHRVLRAGPDAEARARLGTSLPVGEPRHARVFPVARAASAARRAPGALCGRAHPKDRGALAPPRLRVHGLHRAGLGIGGRPRVIALDSRPRLAPKARIRFDRKTARYLLLYPERGLVLNPTAADIAALCTGEHTVHTIVERLTEKYASQPRAQVERDVMAFLATLAERGLMRTDP